MSDYDRSEHIGHVVYVYQGETVCLTCDIVMEVQPCGCLPPRVYCIDHQPEGEE